MEQCLLTIYVPPSVEDSVVDWLLEHDDIEGFSSAEVFGHGVRQSGMSLLEQVTGRQRRVQFQVQTSSDLVEHLLQDLREKFAGSGLFYLVSPVFESGRL
jgi:hypothetical protein